MAQRRRRQLTRNALIFAGTLVAHIVVFMFAMGELQPYDLPQAGEPPIEIQIVPPPTPPVIPPPPVPIIKPTPTPTPKPTPPVAKPTPPQPKPLQPQPQPQPPQPRAQVTPAPKPTAPVQATPKLTQTPAPTPKPAPAPAPITPPAAPAPPGPPKVVNRAPVTAFAPRTVATPHIVLHKDKDLGAPLAPAIAIPGATEAPSPPPTVAGGAPPAAGGGPGLLGGGPLPGFGLGLRGGRLGCAAANAVHLTKSEQDRCDEQFGEGTRESPQFDPIGSAARADLDRQNAAATAAQRYRDSTPSGSEVVPVGGQPRAGQSGQ